MVADGFKSAQIFLNMNDAAGDDPDHHDDHDDPDDDSNDDLDHQPA